MNFNFNYNTITFCLSIVMDSCEQSGVNTIESLQGFHPLYIGEFWPPFAKAMCCFNFHNYIRCHGSCSIVQNIYFRGSIEHFLTSYLQEFLFKFRPGKRTPWWASLEMENPRLSSCYCGKLIYKIYEFSFIALGTKTKF